VSEILPDVQPAGVAVLAVSQRAGEYSRPSLVALRDPSCLDHDFDVDASRQTLIDPVMGRERRRARVKLSTVDRVIPLVVVVVVVVLAIELALSVL
jgi:hypothetical protein